MSNPLSNLTSPSKGLLIVIGAVGLLAGVMAAQATLVPTPAPAASLTAPANDPGLSTAPGTTSGTTATTAEVAPPPQGGQSGGARIVMMVTVLGGLALAWVFMRKRQTNKAGKDGPAMSLVGQLRVGGRWQVALVKVPGKTLVLGATDKGLNLLTTIDEGDLEAQAELRRLDREQAEPGALGRSNAGPMANSADLPDLPGLAAARDRSTTRPPLGRDGNRDAGRDELPDLDALLTGEDRVNVRGAGSPQLQRPLTRPPEPFARLLDELNQLPRQSTATGPIPTAQRDRMRTPEASALRARLERYQGPTN